MNEYTTTRKSSKFDEFKTQLKRSFVLTKKDLRIYYNKPPVIIQGLIFPVILFIALTLGRVIQPIYLISGLMAMVIFLTSTSIGPIVFPWETMSKNFERLITCPISIKTILLGNIWSSFIYGITFTSIPFIIGMIILAIPLSFNVSILISGIILAGLAFASFSLILSVPSTNAPGNTMVLTILIKFPIVFISPLFIQIIISPIIFISPLTYFVDMVNVGLGKTSAFGSLGILLDIGFLLGFGFLSLLFAFKLHEKTLERRFQG